MTTKLMLLAARTAAVLGAAAALEVGGDAAMRRGLQGKPVAFLAGSGLLCAYGLLVNATHLDFGRLMGIYIAIFFVVSQAVAAGVFREKPGLSQIVGGALIVAGGLVMTLWRPER